MNQSYFIEWTLEGEWSISQNRTQPTMLYGRSEGPYETYLDAALNLKAYIRQHIETLENMVEEIENVKPESK